MVHEHFFGEDLRHHTTATSLFSTLTVPNDTDEFLASRDRGDGERRTLSRPMVDVDPDPLAHNRLLWFGDPKRGLWGVTNYPALNKVVGASTMDLRTTDHSQCVRADFIRAASHPSIASGGVMSPDCLAVSPTMDKYLRHTGWLAAFLDDAKITNYHVAWELEKTGPDEMSGALFYRGTQNALSVVMTADGKRTGCVVMVEVGHNILLWMPVVGSVPWVVPTVRIGADGEVNIAPDPAYNPLG
jgi:hypothetical protein